MKKNRLIHLLLIFPMILFAQSKAITGTVIDENKMPLPGVSFLIKDLSQWEYKGVKGYELYDHFSDTSELTNLAEDVDYQKIRDSLIKTLDNRILNAKKVPLGLGRQINNAKPWQEPKRIYSKPK
jgi:hypothetical protein